MPRAGPRIAVAVGTTIADRPPHRSVQARLRIRLLPWMISGKARIRIGMQNAGLRNPPEQEWGETLPAHSRALTATDEDASPQSTNATTENAQLSRVARNGMVLVVAQHNLPKPCTDRGRAIMLPALKLSLYGLELRDHSLLRSNPPDDESSGRELPTVVVKPRNVKVSGFPSPRRFRSRAANRPNSISRVLSACNSKPNLASRSRNSRRNRSASVRC